MTIKDAFIGTIIIPKQTFKLLSQSKNKNKIGWFFSVSFFALFSIISILLSKSGQKPLFTKLIDISENDYYLYHAIITIPLGIIVIGIINYIVIGLSKIMGSSVKISDSWGLISIATTLPFSIFIWLPSIFYQIWTKSESAIFSTNFDIIRLIIAVLWCLELMVTAIQHISKFNWWKSLFIGIISSFIMGSFLFLFYR